MGYEADLCLLEAAAGGGLFLEDSQAQLRHCKDVLVCRAVWKAGEQVRKTPNWPRSWANFSLL